MASRLTRVLILCKTYPSPSGKHVETSCIAGMENDGQLIRLFPVPFRLVDDDQQFKKWQWIKVRVEKAKNDHRPESHKVFVDTIECDDKPLSTKNDWAERRLQLAKLKPISTFSALEATRQARGVTLGLLKPSKILELEIVPARNPNWTPQEKEKLVQDWKQEGFFDVADARKIATLKKVPFDFYYRYECAPNGKAEVHRHKIADWEAGALYWNCRKRYKNDWEKPFREKMETQLPAADLMFLMGTIHRFPDQWLIISLIYPPKPKLRPEPHQKSLFEP